MEDERIVGWLFQSHSSPQTWVVREARKELALQIFSGVAPGDGEILPQSLTARQISAYVSMEGMAILQSPTDNGISEAQ